MQHFFDTGNMEVDEKIADSYQQILKGNITKFKEQAGAYFVYMGWTSVV